MTAHDKTGGGLKLVAFDDDDLAVVSAHAQDASVRVGDMAWLPEERRFAMILSRFDWAAAHAGPKIGAPKKRRRSGLHFDHVRDVRQTNVPQQTPDVVLNLLSITFAPSEAASGFVRFDFSGGASVRLDVECLEGALRDLDHHWPARFKPRHRLR